MNIVTYDDYYSDKKAFFSKHGNDFEVDTKGTSAEYYGKTYVFTDGAIWYEQMRRVFEEEIVEIKKCKIKITADLLQTEYWTNEDSESKFYYGSWDTTKQY